MRIISPNMNMKTSLLGCVIDTSKEGLTQTILLCRILFLPI